MRRIASLAAVFLLTAMAALAATRPHVVAFGKWMRVKWFVGAVEEKPLDMKVRALYVDGRLQEFTTGDPRDITSRLFVVRRAYKINDLLPEDAQTAPKWRWQRGGWLVVNRASGRVSRLNLPEFDPFYSSTSWYRDYVAYCGLSDDGDRLYAVVAQIGRRKPVLRKELGPARSGDLPDSECDPPVWQRHPVRVTFAPKGGDKLTFTIRGHAADFAPEPEREE